MTAVERDSDRYPLCPRCGARLRRRRRAFVFRVLSVLYPVHSYSCTEACGFAGIVSSLSGWARRKRQLRVVLVLMALSLAAGLAVWKYGGELTWSPQPPAGDGIEEGGGG